jgi:hypothetical protein
MNRFFSNSSYLLALALLLLAGCNKYLEETPDNRVELNSIQKAAQLLTNAYTSSSYSFTEWMSDNVAYTRGTTKIPEINQAYAWEDITGIRQDTPPFYWSATYEAIAHANEVLAVIDEIPGEESRRNAVRGEALLTRAYSHFMLVNLFAKHYDSKTASKDLGIPYVKEPEKEFIKTYTRHTVKEVYDDIEEDLLAGLELVNESYYANSGKYHFTKNAALAFASRFYFFKEDLDKCIQYSSELLGTDPSIYVKDIPALLLQKINTDDYIRLYHSPGDNSNLLLIKQISNYHSPGLGYWPSRQLYSQLFDGNPFGLTDERQDPAWVAGENGLAATKYEFLFERSSLTSNVGYNYTIFTAFRGEEVLLNRAECYILQNKINSALADLQLLASKRYRGNVTLTTAGLRSYYGSASDRTNLFYYTQDERRKEFIHEGLRWFDIKRLGIKVTHDLEDGKIITLQATDKRQILQIPQSAIDIGGLKPNPR